MIIHVDPSSGTPIFVLDQMMLVRSLKSAYQKYGIHGIYYAVLFGWKGSPFAAITNESERHELVVKEVYPNTYYDPIQRDEVSHEKLQKKGQYLEQEIKDAIADINLLARVPVIEERLYYQKLLDDNMKDMEIEVHEKDHKGKVDRAAAQGKLITNRKALVSGLEEAMLREKDTLLKKDTKASLDDFITAIMNPVK